LMRLNTAPALDVNRLKEAGALARMTAADLRELGRLPYPMLRRRGEKGFSRVAWEEALKIAASGAAATRPQRTAFYLTSRGLTNEAYYVAQKVARFFGTNNIDNSSRICHAPSTVALKQAIGVAANACARRGAATDGSRRSSRRQTAAPDFPSSKLILRRMMVSCGSRRGAANSSTASSTATATRSTALAATTC
ncbi:MAG: molybdopterin-dependent oxidoreductase, partial [Blastocatellia bacterium]|nr:molybdopterin-dependent oxidoreductase [Blastocatellia bacterium]